MVLSSIDVLRGGIIHSGIDSEDRSLYSAMNLCVYKCTVCSWSCSTLTRQKTGVAAPGLWDCLARLVMYRDTVIRRMFFKLFFVNVYWSSPKCSGYSDTMLSCDKAQKSRLVSQSALLGSTN